MGKAQRNRAAGPSARRHEAPGRGEGSRIGAVEAQSADEIADPHLPEFSVRQADALRRHVVDAARGLGFRTRDRGTHIVVMGGPFTGAGAQIGFSTIAREALRWPESEWEPMVEEIVRQLLAAGAQGAAARGSLGYAGPALRERLFPRFVAPERMPAGQLAEDYTYARDVGGLPLIMAIRREQTSMYVADNHLAKAGGLEEAWEAAEANLFAGGLGKGGEAYVKDGHAIVLLESEHPRQASWLAYPDRLVERLGLEPGPRGVFFSVPALRMITVSMSEETMSLDGIRSMLEINSILAKDEVAPLSPHVYWWRPGYPVQAATSFEDGHLALTLPKSVMEAIAGPDSGAQEVA